MSTPHANPFVKHAEDAIAAHKAGNHSKAMHHAGHMMRHALTATKQAKPPAPFGAAPAAPATPAKDFSGVDMVSSTPTTPPTAPTVPSGFNKGRFAALRGKV